jgi:hypothetical protein
MRRILAVAVALTMTVAVGSASAHGWHHHHHGWVIAGTNASFNGTKNDDGTYTGDLTLTLKKHRDSTDPGMTKTFHLDGTAVKFADSVTDANNDGTVDFSDVQPTDVVVLKVRGGHRFRGHGAVAHKSCQNGGGDNSGDNSSDDSTSTPTIKKAFVFRPQQTAADPSSKD